MISICHNCKGNGFIKKKDPEDGEMTIHQCWECDSKGEIEHENDVNNYSSTTTK
jgi:DnaJ-class molecular chaperone